VLKALNSELNKMNERKHITTREEGTIHKRINPKVLTMPAKPE